MYRLPVSIGSSLKSLRQSSIVSNDFVRYGHRLRKNIAKTEFDTPKLPFKYTPSEKEETIFKSGDLDQTIGKVNYSLPKLYYEMSEELVDADENVKRLFSLEMANRKEIVEFQKHRLISEVQQHKFDTTSDEVRIASLTLSIRSLQEHMRIHQFDKKNKCIINEMIQKRNKRLKLLQRKDLQRFTWLVHKLQIDYKRPLLGVIKYPPTRNGELTRMTKEYCENIKNNRLEAYSNTLKAQQQDFLKEKEEVTKLIEKEEKELGLVS